MKIQENFGKVLEQFDGVMDFSINYPHLLQELKNKHIWLWDQKGYTRELTEEQIQTIERLEKDLEKYNVVVYAVLETVMMFPDTSVVKMHSYLYTCIGCMDDEPIAWLEDTDEGIYSMIAYVHNLTWDIKESGSIFIKRSPGGGPLRYA